VAAAVFAADVGSGAAVPFADAGFVVGASTAPGVTADAVIAGAVIAGASMAPGATADPAIVVGVIAGTGVTTGMFRTWRTATTMVAAARG
jgi:hypothetical protein